MSLSDKIQRLGSQYRPYKRLKVEDVREAVKKLKEEFNDLKIANIEPLRLAALVLLLETLVDEIFGEDLIWN